MSMVWTGVSQMFAQKAAFKDSESAFYHSKEQLSVQTLMTGTIIPCGVEELAVTCSKCSLPQSSRFCPCDPSPHPTPGAVFCLPSSFSVGTESQEGPCMFFFQLHWLLQDNTFLRWVISVENLGKCHKIPRILAKKNSRTYKVLVTSSMTNLCPHEE